MASGIFLGGGFFGVAAHDRRLKGEVPCEDEEVNKLVSNT